MIKRFWERRRDDEGFTLIELMVVVLIIGILIAIALPTFLGARKRAQDRAAQSSLRNGVAAAKVLYTDCDVYLKGATCATALVGTDFSGVEPSLTFQAAASAAPNVLSFLVGDNGTATNQVWSAAAMSDSGTCFWIKIIESGTTVTPGTYYGSGATCTGTAAAAAAGAKF